MASPSAMASCDNDPRSLLEYDPATVVIRASAGNSSSSDGVSLEQIEEFARGLMSYARVARMARGDDDDEEAALSGAAAATAGTAATSPSVCPSIHGGRAEADSGGRGRRQSSGNGNGTDGIKREQEDDGVNDNELAPRPLVVPTAAVSPDVASATGRADDRRFDGGAAGDAVDAASWTPTAASGDASPAPVPPRVPNPGSSGHISDTAFASDADGAKSPPAPSTMAFRDETIRPAVGLRVKVLFSDKVWYSGTIDDVKPWGGTEATSTIAIRYDDGDRTTETYPDRWGGIVVLPPDDHDSTTRSGAVVAAADTAPSPAASTWSAIVAPTPIAAAAAPASPTVPGPDGGGGRSIKREDDEDEDINGIALSAVFPTTAASPVAASATADIIGHQSCCAVRAADAAVTDFEIGDGAEDRNYDDFVASCVGAGGAGGQLDNEDSARSNVNGTSGDGDDADDSIVVTCECKSAEAPPPKPKPKPKAVEADDITQASNGKKRSSNGQIGKGGSSSLLSWRKKHSNSVRGDGAAAADAGGGAVHRTARRKAGGDDDAPKPSDHIVDVKRMCGYHDLGLILSACPRLRGRPYVKSYAKKSTAARLRWGKRTCKGMYLLRVTGQSVNTVEEAIEKLAGAVDAGSDTVRLEFAHRALFGSPKKKEEDAQYEAFGSPARSTVPEPRYLPDQMARAVDRGDACPVRILEVDYDTPKGWQCYVHFVGWKAKYDQWLPEGDILEPLGKEDKFSSIPNDECEGRDCKAIGEDAVALAPEKGRRRLAAGEDADAVAKDRKRPRTGGVDLTSLPRGSQSRTLEQSRSEAQGLGDQNRSKIRSSLYWTEQGHDDY